MGGALAICIYFLLRQRTHLIDLQRHIDENKTQNGAAEVKMDPQPPSETDTSISSIQDDFSENLQIIKDLQSKLDGLTVEMKIRGEMIVERDNKIADLEKEIQNLEAQISIFKNQIAPALEATITELRIEQEDLHASIERQAAELKSKENRIQATHQILKRAGMGNLIETEDLQMELNANDEIIAAQKATIQKLQEQVDQLPHICLQMTNEIKKRDFEINSLKSYNKILNKKLSMAQEELTTASNKTTANLQDLTQKLMELQELFEKEKDKNTLLDKEILMLNSLVLEKESKLAKLEERLKTLLFPRER
ncbi:MAG: hypothetical protein ACTSQI_03820 [Candidatus Helarchaeota archaeon]